MRSIAINKAYGGYGLSLEAVERYCEIKGIKLYPKKETYGNLYYTVPEEERIAELPGRFSDHPLDVRVEWNKKYCEQVFDECEIPRDCPILICVIKELGEEKASGSHCSLRIVEIPDDVKWHIEDYDGNEWVAEDHRTWSENIEKR